MGIRTVVAYSTADARSRAVTLADESICIGPPEPRQSYLNIPSIISAASITECEAIHPGYGLLSENSTFAEVCRACGITFIGPSPEAIRLMGDKAQARGMARAAGVPVVPGSQGPLDGVDEAQALADEVGYPIMVKARLRRRRPRDAHRPRARIAGARLCHVPVRSARLLRILRSVSREVRRGGASRRGPGAGRPERDPRPHGRARLLDPAPPPEAPRGVARHVHLPGHARGLCKSALAVANAVNYVSAGTVEFLVDRAGSFYFIEMNTRIQVEHPVTELVTGFDLVREQIRIAAGESLGYKQDAIQWSGHAIECRINAEDPEHFTPSPGRVTAWVPPGGPGVRVDSHLMAGYVVPPNYDSLVAKIIVHGTRPRRGGGPDAPGALSETVVEGIKTTIPFHLKLLADPTFLAGEFAIPRFEQHL